MLNKLLTTAIPYMPKKFIWLFSKRYIAGPQLKDAIEASEKLNKQNIIVTIDVLGEYAQKIEDVTKNKSDYLQLIDTVHEKNIKGNFSLKPSSFGLLIDEEACFQNIKEIVAKAASYNNFVRIDMEDSLCTDKEINLFRRLRELYPRNVGLVVQAYLKRTLNDIKELMDLHSETTPLNFRLCKGIYVESEEIAFKTYNEINNSFLSLLDFMFQNKIYAGIATHDKPLVKGACKLIEKYKVPQDKFEFQMLFGVTPELRQNIINKGHTMRVYVPYGSQWFGYSTRRLKENPKIASLIIKALFLRG